MIGKTYTTMLGDKELSIETGKLAKLVAGSVTCLLYTSPSPRD